MTPTADPAPERCEAPGARLIIHRGAPSWEGRPTAAIGGVAFENAAAGAALLRALSLRLAAEGIERLIGPMDGDTWHAYRVMTETDGSPPFAMEPAPPPQVAAAFAAAGFAPIARYRSNRAPLGAPAAPPPPDVSVAPWDGADPDARFAEIHAVAAQAFADGPFYRPIGREAFVALYRPYVPLLRPELIFLAHERETGAPVGFFFGLPNLAEGPGTRTVIAKTYAALRPGLGRALHGAFDAAAASQGFDIAIHALIRDDNVSRARSARSGGVPFRRYALLGLRLGGAG